MFGGDLNLCRLLCSLVLFLFFLPDVDGTEREGESEPAGLREGEERGRAVGGSGAAPVAADVVCLLFLFSSSAFGSA